MSAGVPTIGSVTTVRREGEFRLSGEFAPAGDQPQAIDRLAEGILRGDRHQTLLGVTGTGKTFTIANAIARVNKPTLVIAPNKSLGAQLANEFREFFPENAVEYFVSYYDYYQPEAYVPATDTYIEKDSSINDEIERLRHSATSALLTRRDVVIVASVSCIYGLGSPEEYEQQILRVHKGVPFDRDLAIQRLVDIQYERNQANLVRGKFRVQGDTARGHAGVRADRRPHRVVGRHRRPHPPDGPADRRGPGRHDGDHGLSRRRTTSPRTSA